MKTESRKDKFNRLSMQRSWSVPFQIKVVIQYRRRWEDGLTTKDLLKKVKEGFRAIKLIKKANRSKLSAIYDGVSKINLLHIPPFYIDCQGRLISSGKYEYRYFVPYTPEDIQNAKGKQIRLGQGKFTKAKNAEEFGEEIEREKEKEKMIQPLLEVKRDRS